MPSEQRDAAASRFVAALGATMAGANYPVTMVRAVMEQTAVAYGLDHEFLALPNYVQVGSSTGEGIYIANPDFTVRYDQSFPLAQLVARAPSGTISPEEGMAELDRIRHLDKRFPLWITVVGYAVQSVGLALILQPTPWSLYGAAFLGLLVGGLSVIGRRNESIGYMLPTVCAFLVALIVFTFENRWHVGTDSLRALAAPLATFLPGAAITLAVIELATQHVVSGASRLVAGFMQIAQLAFGILIAAQIAGIADTDLVTTQFNRLGPWAPFVGVLVYGFGIWLNFAPPTKFLPWMVLMLYIAYGGQWIGNAVLGSYASGFGGGLTLILFALAISHRPSTPPTMSLVVPGFWLLVPGSLGFMGVTQLLGTHSTAVFTATLISMMSIAVGVQTGLLLWRAAIQLSSSPNRRALHD
ncbi:threonine/serine exporter family protein [Mycobacterium sp. OAE908]|uniref:threonine/serine ThrE exporter family protein n=1 Tax=Mycobacterium sp. OAE908 TaxID=2817899 RepID=UPI001AE57028